MQIYFSCSLDYEVNNITDKTDLYYHTALNEIIKIDYSTSTPIKLFDQNIIKSL